MKILAGSLFLAGCLLVSGVTPSGVFQWALLLAGSAVVTLLMVLAFSPVAQERAQMRLQLQLFWTVIGIAAIMLAYAGCIVIRQGWVQ